MSQAGYAMLKAFAVPLNDVVPVVPQCGGAPDPDTGRYRPLSAVQRKPTPPTPAGAARRAGQRLLGS
jgi:hypothetical protein